MPIAPRALSDGRAYFVTDREKLTFRELVGMIVSVRGMSIEGVRSMP